MEPVQFEQLLLLYRNIEFDDDSREGLLTIASTAILEVLVLLEGDPEQGRATGFSLIDDALSPAIGEKVRVEVGPPRPGLGILVRDFDQLLGSPDASFQEPSRYFVINGKLERGSKPPHTLQTRYRSVLAVVSLFGEASTFVDKTRREMVFVGESKLIVPSLLTTNLLADVDLGQASRLVDQFSQPIHRDQKLGILTATIARMIQPLPRTERLRFLLSNLEIINEDVSNGYRLFASSFSYAKVRSELAAAKLDFTSKVHKTIVDIQGQLLGIPAATIIVATQLKEPTTCLMSWTNFAVILGAWAFVGLLFLALVNQWLTLSAISTEVGRQRARLQSDYAELGYELTSTFDGVVNRIFWHRFALGLIAFVCCSGAIAATLAYKLIVPVSQVSC